MSSPFEKTTMPAAAPSEPPPWNPDRLAGIAFLISIFAPGFVFAFNWRRLGKREWFLPTLLTAILLPLVTLGIPLLFLRGLGGSVVYYILIGVGLSYGVSGGLWYLQRGAYRQWERTRDLSAYEYPFTEGILVGVLAAIVFGGGISGYIYFATRPRTFETADLTITYPSVWETQDASGVPLCQEPEFECVLVLADSSYRFTWIIVGKFPITAGLAAGDVETATRSIMLASGYTFVSNDTLQIDGQAAARHYFLAPVPDDDDLHYLMQVFLARGSAAYQIIVESANEGIFRERQHQIDEFMAGIDFR